MPSILLKCPADRLTKTLISETLISDYYRVPHPTNVHKVDDTHIRITWSETTVPSATVHMPYPVEGHPRVTISTGTLATKGAGLAYHLPTELLRGTLYILRNQLFEWEEQGLKLSDTVQAKIADASRAFLDVLSTPEDERDDLAESALATALDMSQFLVDTYTDQALTARRSQDSNFPVLMGGVVGPDTPFHKIAPHFWEAFNTTIVSTPWKRLAEKNATDDPWIALDERIATTSQQSASVFAGPIISLDPIKLPPDAPATHSLKPVMIDMACDHLIEVVKRYQDSVDHWILADGFAQPWLSEMTPDDRVEILGQLIVEFRGVAPHSPCLLAFDQPWGEYLTSGEETEPPFRWADALLQAMPDLDGVVLEINLADHTHASRTRPPLAFARMIDYWSCLGIPLYLSLSVPGGEGDDPLARYQTVRSSVPDWLHREQQEWIHRFIRLALTKPPVKGIFWNTLCDSTPHDFPHTGLFDSRDKPKPGLKKLTGIRKAFLE
jgi:hypothetical protein